MKVKSSICGYSFFLAVIVLPVFWATTALAASLAVEGIGITVSDLDRAVEFYSQLTFTKVSDVEVMGPEYEHLEGVFGARMRIVRM